MFKKLYYCKRHERTCVHSTNYKLKGGAFTLNNSIFEKLYEFGIRVPDEEQQYDYFAVYDFESILKSTQIRVTDKLVWTQNHIPISVSISSNVPNFQDPVCFVNKDPDTLIKEMIDYLNKIRSEMMSFNLLKWGSVFKQLESDMQRYEDLIETYKEEKKNFKFLKCMVGRLTKKCMKILLSIASQCQF
jgi:predicted oxidoreductase